VRLVALAALLLVSCGETRTPPAPRTAATEATTTSTTSSTTTPAAPTPTNQAAQAATTVARQISDRPELGAIGGGQAIVVRAAAYGQTSATLTAYERAGGGWRIAHGPWTAFVGRAGIAPTGEKREGDGRTPSGTYPFDFMFGVDPDPGVRFPFRRITGHNIVWSDDPESPRYNQWVDTNQADAGPSPESMYVRPQYDLGAVIAYNTERTPGRGSGIFLHVSAGRPTAGCVSLPRSQLTPLLTWLDPARSPAIAIVVA
jgi:L,D-peptidoglycan transpeptidase YkuD (ErfK/YbiS/YcfS/YnhG family)